MTLTRRSLLARGGAALASSLADAPTFALPDHATGKKGLAGAAPVASGLRTDWYYDWGVHRAGKGVPDADPSIRFVPMIWGLNGNTDAALAKMRGTRLPVLFGFNEPDHHDQSNLRVEQALDAWPNLQGIAADLVSPSCAQPHQQWMQRFVEGAERRGLHFDSVGFHHYGSADPHDLIGLLHHVHEMYKRPIWVTEFGCVDWSAHGERKNRYTERDAVRFIETVCPFMERTPWIRGYAWYPWGKPGGGGPLSASAFFQPDGSLTDAGHAYAAV
ncbi:glycosyl hydrolase [Sphingomonas morindae]|uniref:Glycoside hydrolase family protein n=1 Tax=Sphingomonas morindae TaxID=1541170 RepID=A0ABY4XEK1_9SPHN|nr:glycosyl hydrolase [Sphingomonas morindae]USI75244.1 glycoside hydrolase family protein [Sphingomonas morindae]